MSSSAPGGLDAVFPALANPTRRELLRLLLDGPQSVQALAAHFDMARPSVSEHLKVLRVAGLVSENKIGRERHYYLEPEPIHEMRDWLAPYERFWKGRLSLLRATLDEAEENADQVPEAAKGAGSERGAR